MGRRGRLSGVGRDESDFVTEWLQRKQETLERTGSSGTKMLNVFVREDRFSFLPQLPSFLPI